MAHFAEDQIVGLRVAFSGATIRERVKQAGETWNQERWVWQLPYGRVVALGLTACTSTSLHPVVDA